MPLQIDSNKQLEEAGKITRAEIIELLATYRKHTFKVREQDGDPKPFDPSKDSRCGWFSLQEMVDFLKGNGVDLSQSPDLKGLGVRIYFGMHHKDNRFQPKPPTANPAAYHYKDTPILVLTRNGRGAEVDQLDDGAEISMAYGLDNARLCPPECDNTEL